MKKSLSVVECSTAAYTRAIDMGTNASDAGSSRCLFPFTISTRQFKKTYMETMAIMPNGRKGRTRNQ